MPQIPRPTVEKYFAERNTECDPHWTPQNIKSDTLWIPYPSTAAARPARKMETLTATSELSEILVEALHHTRTENPCHGSSEDIEKRMEMYMRLLEWNRRFPIDLEQPGRVAAHLFMLKFVYAMSPRNYQR